MQTLSLSLKVARLGTTAVTEQQGVRPTGRNFPSNKTTEGKPREMNHSHMLHIWYTPGSTNIAGWKMGGPGLSRCMDPIKDGDIPASYVSLPEGIFTYIDHKSQLKLNLGKDSIHGASGTGCSPEK